MKRMKGWNTTSLNLLVVTSARQRGNFSSCLLDNMSTVPVTCSSALRRPTQHSSPIFGKQGPFSLFGFFKLDVDQLPGPVWVLGAGGGQMLGRELRVWPDSVIMYIVPPRNWKPSAGHQDLKYFCHSILSLQTLSLWETNSCSFFSAHFQHFQWAYVCFSSNLQRNSWAVRYC